MKKFKLSFKKVICFVGASIGVVVGARVHAGLNAWTAEGPDGGAFVKVAFGPANASVMYAATYSGFYRSTDSGNNWQIVEDKSLNYPRDIAVNPSDASKVFFAAYDRVYSSSDGGASMSQLVTFPTITSGATQIEFSSDGNVAYVSAGQRFFRSMDGGKSWQERMSISQTQGEALALVVDKTAPNTVYVLFSDKRAYRSIDGGGSWLPITLPSVTEVNDLSIGVSSQTDIWLATDFGVYSSSNLGLSWTQSALRIKTKNLVVDPSNVAEVYAATYSQGVYKAQDSGASWVAVGLGSAYGESNCLAISKTIPKSLALGTLGTLFVMREGDAAWSRRDHGVSAHQITGFSAVQSSDRIYVSTASDGIFAKTGFAGSFAPMNNDEFRRVNANRDARGTWAVLAQSGNPNRVFASSTSTLARSDNGGVSWQLLEPNPSGGSTVTDLVESPDDQQKIVAGSLVGLFYTIDGGDHWNPATGLPQKIYVNRLATTPANSNVVYAALETGEFASTIGLGIYKSLDFGATWSASNSGIESVEVYDIAVDPSNDGVVYAVSSVGVYKSTNGGASWAALKIDGSVSYGNYTYIVKGNDGFSVTIDPANPQIIYVGRTSGAARSVDGGATWQPLVGLNNLRDLYVRKLIVDPVRPDTLLAGSVGKGVWSFTAGADLSVDVSGPTGTVALGATADLVYTVKNLGPYDATGVELGIPLPTGSTNINSMSSNGGCTTSPSIVMCTAPILRAGSSFTVTVSSKQTVVGQYDVVAGLQGRQADDDFSNNEAHYLLSVAEVANLSVTMSGTASVIQGAPLSYTATVSNTGPNAAKDVIVQYQLPQAVTLNQITASTGTCAALNPSLQTCLLGTLATGSTVTVSLTVATPQPTAFEMPVSVSGSTMDPDSTNNAAKVTSVVSAPTSSSSGSGGGGGALSTSMLLFLLLLCSLRLGQGQLLSTRR